MAQQIPPDTSNAYMALGYGIVAIILVGIAAYYVFRARRVRAEIAMLEELEHENPSYTG
jgi:hypothetical protein